MLNLGLIGFGRFGQFAARHLRPHVVRIFVWDLRDQRKRAASLKLAWGTLEEAASCQAVLLAVPISEMPTALAQVGPYLRPGALLMDVCSVKMAPVEWMLAAAPPEVEVIGLHPLFGPQSGRSGIGGLTVALCPARTTKAQAVQSFLEEIGLNVIVTTPEAHDRQMAVAQVLTHFVARGLAEAGAKDQEMKTPSYERLLRVVDTLSRDTPKLFRDINAFNPFAAEARGRLLEALRRLDAEVEQE
ncbi:MAG TPA: prephenate dehydrogenase/arogenate dehydrogenase family protein [Candidatus Polarisedimenticolia bacterium]|nr:prephenate dehydrogenase/arogenate dehydrogenase family protein [Candidatus Polarisedimenticolia bacterium]